jgi:hypothetical protein
MPLFDLSQPDRLTAPALVVALDGWVNAGSAATTAAVTLAEDGEVIASFDGDALFDYRLTRPVIDFEDGVMERVAWPSLDLIRRRLPGRDLLVLTGTEPSWNWRRLSAELADLAVHLGVVEHVSLGGIPWATPHTRPVSMISTASTRERAADDHPEGLLRVPGSAVSIIEHAVAEQGIPTVGFWARVPHYVGTEFAAAALALVERLEVHLGVEIPTGDLVDEVAQQRAQLDAVVAARPDLVTMVGRLEELVDHQEAVSGEELAAEIERFLRAQE